MFPGTKVLSQMTLTPVLEGPCAKIEDWFSVIHVRIISTDQVNADGDLVSVYLPTPMVKTPEKR